ncbi:MAG: peptide chain release factor N(5)-glutamine methyltransferase [Bacteroidales bacterium]|nr:peptide chain release factor N(5)-glutamine methyltransferase [Bacteroidales bacterium]
MIGFNLNLAKRHLLELLTQRYPQREAQQLMRILLEDLFDIDMKQELLHPEMRIDEQQYAVLEKAVNALLEGKPVQYVTGVARFDDLVLHVDESVLIPRPETEELVRHLADSAPHDRPLRLWDVGTGSGCIAIALAKRLPLAEVVAFDVDEMALATAARNAEENHVSVQMVHDDVMVPCSPLWYRPVDIVVSNPPYIRDMERASMEHNVLDYEPDIALFVPDDDPLLFYRQILDLAYSALSPGGCVWFEINEAMGEEMLRLCRDMGYEGTLFEDFAGKTRFCRIIKSKN